METKRIFLFGLGLFLLPFFASADVSQFVFTTDPQTIKPSEISGKITIQAQDASSSSTPLLQTGCLKLETSSATGQFSSSNTNWKSVDILTISKGDKSRSFYYKDSSIGTYTFTINIALRPETETKSCSSWPIEEWNIQWTATQDIVVSSDSGNGSTGGQSSQSQGSSQTNQEEFSWPVEPQIYANAGSDRTGVVGADMKFLGQALGLQKEPLENARYVWCFGDGASREGQNVIHVYQYPGEYVVFLNVSSGKYSASDRALIRIVPNQLKIVETTKDFIKLKNYSNSDLDISNWYLKTDGKTFRFPETTLIRAGAEIPVSSSVSGLSVQGSGQIVELLYSNNSLAFRYSSPAKPVSPAVITAKAKTEIVEEEIVQEDSNPAEIQVAAIGSSVDKNFWYFAKWLGIVLGIGLIAGGGLFFVRRQGSP